MSSVSVTQAIIQSEPVKRRAGVGLASRCDVAVANNAAIVEHRIHGLQCTDNGRQNRVLPIIVCGFVLAFEFDTDREIVAAVFAPIAGCASVPGALGKRHELHYLAVATNQQVRRNLEAANLGKIRMCIPIERIAEQRFDFGSAKFTRRQTDAMQNEQLERCAIGASVAIWARYEACGCNTTGHRIDGVFARVRHIRHDRDIMGTRLLVSEPLSNGAEVTLRDDQVRYLTRALRARVGDRMTVFDGNGPEWRAEVVGIDKSSVRLKVGESFDPGTESALRIHLVQGVSRGERMDFAVQKATELGVKRITPVLTEFGVVKLAGDRAVKRQSHWQSVANSATEQSGRTRPPKIDTPISLNSWFGDKPDSVDTELLLLPGAKTALTAVPAPKTKACVLIGPEGGFSDREIDDAGVAGFQAVSLGPRILRTETAAVAAVAVMQAVWENNND